LADKYLSAAGKRRKVYINTFEAFDELMADICRQKTSSYYSCHSKHIYKRTVEAQTKIVQEQTAVAI
jgi:hypothetical protein